MNDSELCKMFGTTVEQVEVDCEKYESGDFSGWELGKPIDGRPKAPMNAADDKTYTVSSREVIYKGACNDVDLNPYRDAVLWYVGNDRDEASASPASTPQTYATRERSRSARTAFPQCLRGL